MQSAELEELHSHVNFHIISARKKVCVMGKSFWKGADLADLAEVWQSRLVGTAGVKLGQKANVH